MQVVDASAVDFSTLIRAGERVVVGQATSEPLTLTRKLMREVPAGGCSVFLGPVYSDTFATAPAGVSFESYGAIGQAARLAKAGRLDVLPLHYSAIDRALGDGTQRADCVMVQLSRDPAGKGYNLGLANDHVARAAHRARLVIAEINDDVPVCHGGEWPDDIPIHVCVRAETPPLEVPPPSFSNIDLAIGAKAAALIPDRAVLQFGVGTQPQAVIAQLKGHRDLALHSGALMDGVVDMVERGVITNAFKERDRGISAGGVLIGSRKLYDFVDGNAFFRLTPPAETHALPVLAGLLRFCAINSAVEVDLTGQINSEVAEGRYVGAVGGQVNFIRGANASEGGRAIIVLPATARGGTVSRIVPQVSTVTCSRSDADAIVTEWGVAELRGCGLDERAKRMIAIAAPQFREELEHRWREMQGAAHG